MSDIVERLRSGEDGLEYAAADGIERLRAEAARLRDAGAAVLDYLLLPEWLNKPGGDSDVWAIRKSDLRALRDALAAKEPGHE